MHQRLEGKQLAAAFWSAAICRPDFIFDIRPSCPVEASIEVTAQAFYDAHEASDQKLGKNSDLKKFLFKKDLEDQTYYDGIYNMPKVSFKELDLPVSCCVLVRCHPLPFWSDAIRYPDLIFDIRPSRPVEASVEVIAQAFYDAHEATDQKLGKDSDLKKYLENQTYADGIYNMP
ncbi:plexin-B2-like [Asterias amurensis]|uniref:plexin-B2-like n=1 Tax=Asterias amurensis TaxID=7602 RepID=UPI003AB872C6